MLAAAIAAVIVLVTLGGCTQHHDVDYGSAYPNGTFDIYPGEDSGEFSGHMPVFIYVHGGGYIGGDKALDDPASMGAGVKTMTSLMGERGWTVVSMNYAYAPECGHPTPVLQLGELVAFLQAHEKDYGIDMTRVAFGGGSAGGQIAAQYVATQLDGRYAAELGVKRLMQPGQIKALYLGCALIDPARFAQTDNAENDAKFSEMQAAYFHGSDAAEANLLDHLGADFPPCYIVDCAEGSFAAQARELATALDELGVRNELRIYEGQYHGFDASGTDADANDAVSGWLAFVR